MAAWFSKLRFIFPKQLVLQIPLLVIFLLMVTVVVYTWIAAANQLRHTEQNIKLMGSTLSKNIAVASADYVLSNDFASLEQLLLRAADFPEVERIQISDREGRILSDVLRSKDGKAHAIYGSSNLSVPLFGENNRYEKKKRTAIYWHPIDVGGLVGWVRVQQS